MINESALAAGRNPWDVVRAVNVMAPNATPSKIVEQLLRIIASKSYSWQSPSENPIDFVRRLGEEVAPAIRRPIRLRHSRASHDPTPVHLAN